MRDPNRIYKVTNELAKMWSAPGLADMRFGQLLSNFFGWVMSNEENGVTDIWFPEEDEWIELFHKFSQELCKKNKEKGD